MLASSKAIFTCLTLADALYRSGHCWGWPPVPSGQERDSHNSFQCCFGRILVAGEPICTPRHLTRVIDNVGKLVLVGVADIIGLGLEWVKDFNLVCGLHQAILAPTFRGGLWEDLKWTSKETNTPLFLL